MFGLGSPHKLDEVYFQTSTFWSLLSVQKIDMNNRQELEMDEIQTMGMIAYDNDVIFWTSCCTSRMPIHNRSTE